MLEAAGREAATDEELNMDFVGKLIQQLIDLDVLNAACLMALVCIYIMYRLLISKDKVIEKLTDALSKNTIVMAEIKTLLGFIVGHGGPQ